MMSRPRIVVVGAGHLGAYHLEKFAADASAELVAVVDTDPDTCAAAAAKYNIAAAPTLATLDVAVDAAVIATPTTTHLDLASQALARGWHVLVEKPIASTLREAELLVKRATEAGRILQVGHVERFNPAIAAALAVADKPRYIVAERLGRFSGRSTDVDVVLDLMIHDLDIVASLVAAEVTEVRAVGVPVMTHAVDMASARLEFADGTVAQLSAGRASLEPSRKLRLFTVERYLSIDCAKREVKCVRRLPPAAGSDWPQITGEVLDVPNGDPLALQAHDFIDCILHDRTPRVSGQAGLRALALAEAIKAAMTVPKFAEMPG